MPLNEQVLEIFLVFCRVGSCLAVMPGLSSARVPMRARLYLAVAIAFLIGPIVESASGRVPGSSGDLFIAILSECVAGVVIGFVARLFVEALEFAGMAAANYIGLNSIAVNVDGGEPEPALANLIGAVGVLVLMILELPQHMIVGLAESYSLLSVGEMPHPSEALRRFGVTLAMGFSIGLQITAPFLVFAITTNAMFAVLGKLVPQVQSYFLSVPFLAMGGLFLLYFSVADIVRIVSTVANREVLRF